MAFGLLRIGATSFSRTLATMKLLRTIVSSLLPVGLMALQISCGGSSGEPSGPNQVATSIEANSSPSTIAPPGASVTELPSVLIRDQNGTPEAGVPVTFSVTAGGGTLTGGTATTNASGIATVGSWTLGPGDGANTLTASSGSLSTVVFTACATPAHTIGSITNSQLSATDCQFGDGSFVDFYSVALPTAGTYTFNQSSTSFDTFLTLLTATGTTIGVNDDFGSASATDSRVKAIVPAGTYIIGANSFDANIFGSYSLASGTLPDPVTNCEDVFVLRGITTLQGLQTTDCVTNGFFSDEYVVFLNAGQTITVSMSSSALDSYVEIREVRRDGTSPVVVFNDDIDATTKNARVTYNVPTTPAPSTGFFIIAAASRVAGATGDYSLTVQ
jgi:hypothetical protein